MITVPSLSKPLHRSRSLYKPLKLTEDKLYSAVFTAFLHKKDGKLETIVEISLECLHRANKVSE